MGRRYILPFNGLTSLTAVPFAQLATPATTGIILLGIELGQEVNEVSEQAMITLTRRSTASTLPTSTTPLKYNPNDPASLLTGSTTTNAVGIASVTGTVGDTWPIPPFNILNGLIWVPPTELIIPPSAFITVQFKTAPSANTWSGFLHFEERE